MPEHEGPREAESFAERFAAGQEPSDDEVREQYERLRAAASPSRTTAPLPVACATSWRRMTGLRSGSRPTRARQSTPGPETLNPCTTRKRGEPVDELPVVSPLRFVQRGRRSRVHVIEASLWTGGALETIT
jgi:hypothetical protein